MVEPSVQTAATENGKALQGHGTSRYKDQKAYVARQQIQLNIFCDIFQNQNLSLWRLKIV